MRAKKLAEPTVQEPAPMVQPIPQELVVLIIAAYEDNQQQAMEHLHNQMIGFIAASGVTVANSILVLELLMAEAVTLARQKYLGE